MSERQQVVKGDVYNELRRAHARARSLGRGVTVSRFLAERAYEEIARLRRRVDELERTVARLKADR